MPKIAFVLLKSPQELDPSHSVRRFADKQDSSLILFEDGVYHALIESAADRLAKIADEVLVASDDLEARGFAQSDLKIGRSVGYSDIVDCIMERTERTITL